MWQSFSIQSCVFSLGFAFYRLYFSLSLSLSLSLPSNWACWCNILLLIDTIACSTHRYHRQFARYKSGVHKHYVLQGTLYYPPSSPSSPSSPLSSPLFLLLLSSTRRGSVLFPCHLGIGHCLVDCTFRLRFSSEVAEQQTSNAWSLIISSFLVCFHLYRSMLKDCETRRNWKRDGETLTQTPNKYKHGALQPW